MEFYAGLYGLKKQQREERIRELLRMVDLSEHRVRLAGALSGGMYQRLSLACTLIHEPQLLLLDEPTVGIDPRLRQTFWDYFNRLARAGKTVLINAAIAFIRERSQGTLEKFMVSPLSRVEMVSGYVLGFSLFTLLQSATTLFVVTFGFGVPLRGSPLTALAVVLLLGAGALVLGSFFSNFARSEFQVVQFNPSSSRPRLCSAASGGPCSPSRS